MEDLENLFHSITETLTLESLQDGIALIAFPEISHAEEAIKLHNNTEFMGNIVHIEKEIPEIIVMRERGRERPRGDGDRGDRGNKGERGGRDGRGERRSRSRERRSRSRDRHPRERERERDDRRRSDYDDRSRRGGGRERSRDRGNGNPPPTRRERTLESK